MGSRGCSESAPRKTVAAASASPRSSAVKPAWMVSGSGDWAPARAPAEHIMMTTMAGRTMDMRSGAARGMPASFRGAACTPAQAATNSAFAGTLQTDLNMFKLQLDRRGTAAYSLNMFKDSGRAVPQRAASEETRRQILETALALFRERGFEDTTMRDVAARAGLSLGSAYYYFKSKEA